MTSEQDTQNMPSEAYEELEYEMDGDGIAEDTSPYSQSEATRGIEEDDASKEDEFSRLGESSDDPEQKRLYMEYLTLIKDIDCQNQTIEQIKGEIMELCAKPCKTKCEIQEIKRLRDCMEQENLKLHCLMNKAIKLQNLGSHRRYHEIPIATTIDEDNMKPYVGCIMSGPSAPWRMSQQQQQAHQLESSEQEQSASYHDAKEEKSIRCICNALGKMKTTCPDDRKLIKEIATLLCCSKPKPKPPCTPCSEYAQRRPQPAIRKSRSMPRQFEGRTTVDSIEKLKQKIICMQSSVNKLKQEIVRRERENRCLEREREQRGRSYGREQRPRDCNRRPDDSYDRRGCSQERRRQDRGDCREPPDECECQTEFDQVLNCIGKRNTKSDQIEKLKADYCHLMTEFAKKEALLRDLEIRMKAMCGGCGGKSDALKGADEAELSLLRQRVNEMKEEQVEFKCIMKEQSQQLEDYRNKYLIAQQKVEEQSVTLEKLNMSNKRIEKQINTEIKEIRSKFQEKLKELVHIPKLLENEQLKLAQACKEKDDLQGKLVLVCKELKALKAAAENPPENTDCRPQLVKCQLELSAVKQKLEHAENQRDLYCEELKKTQDELDTLRSESAKIIARTKERTELLRQQQQEQIDRLEKELAQCRATASLSVNDREAVIREMQGQLNTLSYSFDAAQKQIKTLRNHIAYVSNDNCFPVKC